MKIIEKKKLFMKMMKKNEKKMRSRRLKVPNKKTQLSHREQNDE